MSVILTERAAKEVKRVISEQNLGDAVALRVQIMGGGCSGFSYNLGFDESFDEKTDTKFEQFGVPVIVDKKSALFLDGTTLDFQDEISGRGFKFDNPNAVKTCGCGSSFQA